MSATADPPFHPLANLFPLIEGDPFADLVDDIEERGLEDPIVLHQGMILDGRNRFRACRLACVEPRFTIFGLAGEPPAFMVRAALAGEALTDHQMRLTPIDLGELPADFTVTGVPGADALGYVISKNMHRRHLDASQRALVAARLATMRQGERTDIAEPSANLRKVSQSEAAVILHVSERSVTSAAEVIEHGAPELVAAVEQGAIAVSAAASLASLPLEEQRRVIETADPRAIGAVAKAAREDRQAEKKRAREAKERGLAARQRLLPDKRYGVIYADPEWRFEPYSRESGMDRAADNHYPTSETSDIVLRPVGDIADKDCVLFLWATAPMLPAALRVMAGWGFAYKSQLIWNKDRTGTGYWFRNKHELLLVGTRGDVPAPAMGDQWPSVVDAPVEAHSAKPDVFAELIESYFPNLPKIELNARRARPGWDVWGLEAPEGPSAEDLANEHGLVELKGRRVAAAYVSASELEEARAIAAARAKQAKEHEQADSSDLVEGSAGGEAPGGLCGSGDEDVRPDGASGSPRDAGEEGDGGAGRAGAAVTAEELAEFKALSAIDAGLGVEGPLVERLIAEGFVKRNGDGSLRTVMLGGLHLMTLSRKIGAARVEGDADAVRVAKAAAPSFRPGSLLHVERGSGPDGAFVLVEMSGPDKDGRYSLVLDNRGVKNPRPTAWINELTWDGAACLVGAHGYCISEVGFSEEIAAVLAKRAARGENGRFSIVGDCDATDAELMVLARREAEGAIAWTANRGDVDYATVAWLADDTFESPSLGTHYKAYEDGVLKGIASFVRRDGSVEIHGYHLDGIGYSGSTMPISKVRAFLRAWGKAT